MLRLIQPPGRIVGGEILFHCDDGEIIDIAQLTEADDMLFKLVWFGEHDFPRTDDRTQSRAHHR